MRNPKMIVALTGAVVALYGLAGCGTTPGAMAPTTVGSELAPSQAAPAVQAMSEEAPAASAKVISAETYAPLKAEAEKSAKRKAAQKQAAAKLKPAFGPLEAAMNRRDPGVALLEHRESPVTLRKLKAVLEAEAPTTTR